jgi:hypothetical protein
VRAIQCTQFRAKNAKNDLTPIDLVKQNFCFETEGVVGRWDVIAHAHFILGAKLRTGPNSKKFNNRIAWFHQIQHEGFILGLDPEHLLVLWSVIGGKKMDDDYCQVGLKEPG